MDYDYHFTDRLFHSSHFILKTLHMLAISLAAGRLFRLAGVPAVAISRVTLRFHRASIRDVITTMGARRLLTIRLSARSRVVCHEARGRRADAPLARHGRFALDSLRLRRGLAARVVSAGFGGLVLGQIMVTPSASCREGRSSAGAGVAGSIGDDTACRQR